MLTGCGYRVGCVSLSPVEVQGGKTLIKMIGCCNTVTVVSTMSHQLSWVSLWGIQPVFCSSIGASGYPCLGPIGTVNGNITQYVAVKMHVGDNRTAS